MRLSISLAVILTVTTVTITQGQTLCGHDCGGEPWHLFSQDNGHGIIAGGWINAGIMLNATNNNVRNDPVPFSNPSGELLGNQTWGYVEKVADNGGSGWAWGARFDAVFGADGPDTQAFGDGGWDFGWNSGGEYGTAIPQLYAEVQYNDLSVKVGHFYTIMGYEVVQAPGNFFYSHAYTMTYGEPFTHTGILAEYAHDADTTLWAGYTMGWDSGFENEFDAHTFLGGISRQLTDDINVAYTVNAGRYGNGIGPAGNLGDIFMHSLVVDVQLTNRLNYVFLHDMGINSVPGVGINSVPGVGSFGNLNSAEWYGVTQYLLYRINDCLKAGMRFEWFDDADGLRISTVNDGNNDLHFFGATLGLNWTPTPNILIRPEFRFDWTASHSDMDFNDIYINNTKSNIDVFAIDFTFLF